MSLNQILAITESVGINDQRFVGQVLSRNQRISTSEILTVVPFQFTLTPMKYLYYSQNRDVLANLRYFDKALTQYLNFGATGWVNYIAYQGDMNSGSIAACQWQTSSANKNLVLGNLPTMSSSAYIVRAGDFCQVGLYSYIATADVFGLSSDGTTKALIPASSLTYPADVAEEVWTLESAKLGGTDIDISSLECSISSGYENNDPEKCYAYGLPQPKDMYRAGNIMVETIIESLDQLFAVPTTGALVTIWRQFSAGAGFGATKTITFVGLSVKEESAPAPGKDASKRRIKITGGLDGSNKPITVS